MKKTKKKKREKENTSPVTRTEFRLPKRYFLCVPEHAFRKKNHREHVVRQRNLYIEFKENHIAILHNVFFSL